MQAMTEQPGDERARNALQDLVPYAVLHVEQRLAARDRAEAARVLALLTQAQGDAPALPRLQQALQALSTNPTEQLAATAMAAAAGDTSAARARTNTDEDSPRRPDTVADASNTFATPTAGAEMAMAEAHRPDTSAPAVTSPPAATIATADESGSAALAGPIEPSTASSAPSPDTAVADTVPRILRQVAPRYPPIAGRRGQEGEVEVAFTINPDGRVSDVVVIRSEPPRVFDRAAIAAMEDWRYEAPGRSVRSSRTFAFRMD